MPLLRALVARLGRGAIALPIAGMAGIFTLSSFPGGEQEVLGVSFEVAPKVGNFLHLPAYFTLATLWKIALEARQVPAPRSSWLAVVLATAFGALDELHQYFVPERCMDAKDALANLLGALIAVPAWPWVRGLFFPGVGRGARRSVPLQ
jgi:hypothetical protein